jgi:hypothetical protein
VGRGAHEHAGARSGERVGDEDGPGRAHDVERGGPEAMAQRHRGAAEAGGNRVAVAPEGHGRSVVDGCRHLQGGRIRGGGQGRRRLFVGQLADGRPPRPGPVSGRRFDPGRAAQPGVPGRREEPVEAHLGHLHRVGGQRPPPPAGGKTHRSFDGPLAVPPPGRAGHDDGPVVLGDRGEVRLDVDRPGHDDRGHPVDPPPASGAAQAAQDAVHRLDEMCLVGGRSQHAPGAARVGKGAQQDVGGAAPGRRAPLEPVPLDLLAGGMIDVYGVATSHAGTGLAVRAELRHAHLADEGGVAEGVAERDHLVEQRRGPHVGVVGEPGPQVGHEPLERIGRRAPAHARGALALQVGTDRLAVPSQVAGDR